MGRASSRKLLDVATPPDLLARERIKRWVTEAGLRQKTFGKRIGKDQVWVSRYLAGKHNADLETLQRMAAVFHVTLDALLHEPDASRAPILAPVVRDLAYQPAPTTAATTRDASGISVSSGTGRITA